MPELMNDLRIRCPKCASEDLSPVSVEVNRAEPPINILVEETQVLIREGEDSHKVVAKIHCNACGAGVFWLTMTLSDGEVWVKMSADPDDDEQGPQAETATAAAPRKRGR